MWDSMYVKLERSVKLEQKFVLEAWKLPDAGQVHALSPARGKRQGQEQVWREEVSIQKENM